MPKINVTQVILDMNGSPLMGPPAKKDAKPEPMTVRTACMQALLSTDEKQTGSHKFDCYRLATKILEEDTPMIEAQDIMLIKESVGKLFYPIVVGRVWDALELKTKPKAVANLPVDGAPFEPESQDGK